MNRRHPTVSTAALCLLLLFLHPPAIRAARKRNRSFDSFTLYWENDFFAGTDLNYTNGLKFTFSTPYVADHEGSRLPRWSCWLLDRLPLVSNPRSARAVTLSLGQNIFTPEDTDVEEPIEDQRPYAGYLYLAFGFHNMTVRRKNTWEIDLGVVGPASLAEQAQNLIHDLIGSARAKGWDNQLKNEPAIEIIYESKWRLLHSALGRGFAYDFIPHLGARLGNVAIYVNTGAELRFGWHLPSNFGSCPIRPGCEIRPAFNPPGHGAPRKARLGVHLLVAVDGRAVLRDIFLDGNSFTNSLSVDKENLVADLMVGITLSYRRFRLSYAHVYRTVEYVTQKDPQLFGSVQLSFSY